MKTATVRIFTGYSLTEEQLAQFLPGRSLSQPNFQIFLNQSGPADLTLVFSYAPLGSWTSGNSLGIYKVIADPVQVGLFGRFTRTAPRWATKVLTPTKAQAVGSSKFIYWPTLVFWHLGKSFDELQNELPIKQRLVSCVASAKRDLPGHKLRDDFVCQLEDNFDSVDVYGRGRKVELGNGKWDGIAPYHFSIAIENTIENGYFTEKILDCFLAMTIPIYFGAPDISDHFPDGSFIALDSLDPAKIANWVESGKIGPEAYENRREALDAARRIVLKDHTLDALIYRLLTSSELGKVKGKQRLETLDSFLHALRDGLAKMVGR